MWHQPGVLTRGLDTATDATALDTIEEAITDLRVGSAHCAPNLVVVNPTTWSMIRRTKDSMGRYLVGDPLEDAVYAQWGVPVLQTTTVTPGTALLADMTQFAAAFVRLGLTLQTDYGDNGFSHNVTWFPCEERLGLACPRPAAGIIVSGLPGASATTTL